MLISSASLCNYLQIYTTTEGSEYYVQYIQYRYIIHYITSRATYGGTRWRNWLRHCAISRKVAGSIPDGVIATFHWHNPSGRTVALGLTQPLTEMSTRNISWEVKAAGAYDWQTYHLHVLTVLKSGSLNLLEPSGPVQVCNGIVLHLPLTLPLPYTAQRIFLCHIVRGSLRRPYRLLCTVICILTTNCVQIKLFFFFVKFEVPTAVPKRFQKFRWAVVLPSSWTTVFTESRKRTKPAIQPHVPEDRNPNRKIFLFEIFFVLPKSILRCTEICFFLLLSIAPRWLMPRMYCSHIGLLCYP